MKFPDKTPLQWVLLPPPPLKKNRTAERRSSVVDSSSMVIFCLLKPASKHAHAHLLLRLSWSWFVLLLSDTHRKPITPITAVTYLLTLPHIFLLIFPYFILLVYCNSRLLSGSIFLKLFNKFPPFIARKNISSRYWAVVNEELNSKSVSQRDESHTEW
jgi:hypothetical protein